MAETEIVVDVHTEKLTQRLTDEARMVRAKQLAEANRELVAKKEERSALTSALAAQEKEITARIGVLSAAVALGIEPADVEVKGYIDFKSGLVRYRRSDTGEETKTRVLHDDERQMQIPDKEAIRATICQHITAKPTDGTLPRYCKTCQDKQSDEPPRKLEIVDNTEPAPEAPDDEDSSEVPPEE